VSQDRLNASAVLSTARQFFTSIPDFNQEVMCFQEPQTGEWSSATCDMLTNDISLHSKVSFTALLFVPAPCITASGHH